MLATKAREAIDRCRLLAACSEEPGVTTRTYLSAPMREVHAHLTGWMKSGGMTVDAFGQSGPQPPVPKSPFRSLLKTVL